MKPSLKTLSIVFITLCILLYLALHFSKVALIYGSNKTNLVTYTLADSEQERAKGLSGSDKLADNSSMLFIFPTDTNDGFWMKDMKYSLDIIFIDRNNTIIDIKKSVVPCTVTVCDVIYPVSKYRYVLEVNGGYTDAQDIKVGDRFSRF